MKSLTSRLLTLLITVLALSISAASGHTAVKKKKEEKPAQSIYDMPMRVVIVRNNIPGCEPFCPQWISAEGQITPKTPAVFKKALAKAQKLKLPIVVTSTGGDVDAALSIGKMIRASHLDVVVGWTYFAGCPPHEKTCKLPKEHKGVYRGIALSGRGFCVSACAFILASGERRLWSEGSYVGVHQISRTVTQEKVRYLERYRIVNGKKKVMSRKIVSRKPMKSYVSTKLDRRLEKKLAAYFTGMGIDGSLLGLFNKAPPSSMYMLSKDEVRTTRLITDESPAVDMVASSICAKAPPAENCVLLEAAKP